MRLVYVMTALFLSFAAAAQAEVVYNRGNLGDPQSLDPHKTSTTTESHIYRDLYEGLLVYDAESNAIAGAAESWTLSPDGRVYTFKIRKDAVWSNGDPVTADDFIYAFQRILNPANASKYPANLYQIVNAEEINQGKAAPDQLGVKALDPKTLQITLNVPTGYFLELTTHHSYLPLHRASIEKFGADWVKPGNMVTNGPFKLAEVVPNERVRLVKNDKFREAAQVKIDVINYMPLEDRSAALKRFEAGEVDSYNDLPMEQIDYIREKLKGQYFIGPYLGNYYYAIKATKPPFNNPKLRRALSMMIDREQLADKIFRGTMVPAYGVVPPGLKGYKNAELDFKSLSPFDREEEARKIMTELGYSPQNPLKLDLRFNTSENHKNIAVAMADMMKPYGVETTLTNTDGKTHFAYMQNGGDFDLGRGSWVGDYRDPFNFLMILQTGEGHNYGRYSNKDYDDLLDKSSVEVDPAKRLVLLAQAEAVAMKDAGMIPLFFHTYKNLISRKLKGFVPNLMDAHPSRWMSKEL